MHYVRSARGGKGSHRGGGAGSIFIAAFIILTSLHFSNLPPPIFPFVSIFSSFCLSLPLSLFGCSRPRDPQEEDHGRGDFGPHMGARTKYTFLEAAFFRRQEGPRVVIKWDPISSLEDPRQQCQRETKRHRRGCRGPWSLWLRGTKGRNYLFSQVPHRIQLKRERKGGSFSLFRNSIRRAPQAY